MFEVAKASQSWKWDLNLSVGYQCTILCHLTAIQFKPVTLLRSFMFWGKGSGSREKECLEGRVWHGMVSESEGGLCQ